FGAGAPPGPARWPRSSATQPAGRHRAELRADDWHARRTGAEHAAPGASAVLIGTAAIQGRSYRARVWPVSTFPEGTSSLERASLVKLTVRMSPPDPCGACLPHEPAAQ